MTRTMNWQADKTTYIRDHVMIAAVGAVGTCLLLWWIGNADWWVGLIAAPAAVAVRGVYLASEELALSWELTADAVVSSQGKRIPLDGIARVRSLGSAVQIITKTGDKHLMKYFAEPATIRDAVARAAGVSEE